MARYNGKPKASKPLRYEVALCGKDVYGVYDNANKRFHEMNIAREVAVQKVSDLNWAAFDRMFVGLVKKSLALV